MEAPPRSAGSVSPSAAIRTSASHCRNAPHSRAWGRPTRTRTIAPPPAVAAPALRYGLGAGRFASALRAGQDGEPELLQLRGVDGGRRPRERVGARLRLRERDHLANVVLAREDGHEPVDAEREPCVRRRAVA